MVKKKAQRVSKYAVKRLRKIILASDGPDGGTVWVQALTPTWLQRTPQGLNVIDKKVRVSNAYLKAQTKTRRKR